MTDKSIMDEIDKTTICECKEPSKYGSFSGLFCKNCMRYISEEARGFKGKKTDKSIIEMLGEVKEALLYSEKAISASFDKAMLINQGKPTIDKEQIILQFKSLQEEALTTLTEVMERLESEQALQEKTK